MKILFIYPEYSFPIKNPPVGLASIAAYLQHYGFSISITDFNVSSMTNGELIEYVKNNDYKAIGISFMTSQYGKARDIAETIKTALSGIPIIVGGPHISALPKETLEELNCFDIAVYGEGEETARELFECLEKGKALTFVKGICFRQNGRVLTNPPREMIEDLDSLPFPAWDRLDMDKYSVHSTGGNANVLTFALLSSRGCPAKCTFCDSRTIFKRKFRARSAENIYKEIVQLHENYGMVQFDFVDDLITTDKDRIMKLCRILNDSPVPFRWMANARLNTLNREMLVAMKNAGCVRIDVGVESGDPEVRKKMRKGVTNEQITEIHKICKEIGLYTGTFLMVGNMGETWKSLEMTVSLMKDIIQDAIISISCPYPGTELYRVAKEKGFLRVTDWSQYSTAPTYVSNYKPLMVTDTMNEEEILKAFYYLHSHFAWKKFSNRYGKFFYVNPKFWYEWVLRVGVFGGFRRKARMVIRLLFIRIEKSMKVSRL